MPVHAFADESRRGSTYLIAVAIAEPAKLRQLRRDLRCLLLPGQREVHFKLEKEPRQRAVAAAVARLPVEVSIYRRSCERHDEPARQDCVHSLVRDLVDRKAQRLVLDTRQHRDKSDEATIRQVLTQHPHRVPLVYEHLDSVSEPLLWVADAVAWCYGAGGRWRGRISSVVTTVSDLD